MALEEGWFPTELDGLLSELSAHLGGLDPILNITEDDNSISSCLHAPTLFPELTVPSGPQGDWGKVARGIRHLTRALNGMPELRVWGTKEDEDIARELNSELEWLASIVDGIVPPPKHNKNLLVQVQTYVDSDHTNRLDAQHSFSAFKLLCLEKDGSPQARDALVLFGKHFPDALARANGMFKGVLECNLNTPVGKAGAASLLIESLGFTKGKFYFQENTYTAGASNYRNLDYYVSLQHQQSIVQGSVAPPYTVLEVQIPFEIPALQGAYLLQEGAVILMREAVSNRRATWSAHNGAQISSFMDASGLYSNSKLRIYVPGSFGLNDATPPNEQLYKNYRSYPKVVQRGVALVDELIAYVRRKGHRCDIPEILPSHFNQVKYQQVNELGNVTNEGQLSLEYVRVSTGPPVTEDLVSQPVSVTQPLFHLQLLEAAKLYLLQRNVRRAILDFSGAFEAFVALHITDRLAKSKETVKERFLRTYKQQLSEDQLAVMALLEPNDQPLTLPIRKILKLYEQENLEPAIGREFSDAIMKVFDYRNDAAHGRSIDNFSLEKLEAAIDAFEVLENLFNQE